MWKIIKNEWQYYSRTKWLLSISVGFVLVLFLAAFLGNRQVEIQSAHYELAQQELREEWESLKAMNPHRAAHYGTYLFKPVNLLSSLDEGVNSVTGNVLRVEGHVQNEIVHSEASQMQAVSKFGKLKTALLLQYIVPILLIFLAFSSVSKEKESGRFKLLILQGNSPVKILLAKSISVWLYALGLLLICIFSYTLLNLDSINTAVVNRSALFFLSYSLYYFIISALTVFFTARWRKATLALTSMLGIWIVWTVFIPNIAMSSVEQMHELPSRNTLKANMKEDRSKGLDGHNPSDERKKELEKNVLKEYGVDSLSQLPINFDGLVMQADEEYGNKVWDKHFGKLRDVLLEQKQSYQYAGLLNPFISLQNVSMGSTGTDNLHHQSFLVQVENYRRMFIKMLNDEHAFGGSQTGDWSWEANTAFFKSIPDFSFKLSPLGLVLERHLMDLLFLFAWTGFSLLLIVFGTKKIQIL